MKHPSPHKLSPINRKIQNPRRIIEKLLQPIKILEILSCSETSDSGESDLEDVFEGYHNQSYFKPMPGKRRKYYSKYEADKKIVEQFTEEFKRTVRITREKLQINHPLEDEIDADIETALQTSKEIFKNRITRPDETPIEITVTNNQDTQDNDSSVWQLLLAYSSPDFKVSPPGFDAYKQETSHWLERPKIPWEVLNESTRKCERWLNQYDFDNY